MCLLNTIQVKHGCADAFFKVKLYLKLSDSQVSKVVVQIEMNHVQKKTHKGEKQPKHILKRKTIITEVEM